MLIYQVIELEKNIVNHQCTIYLQNTCNRLTHDERMIKFSSKNLQCRREFTILFREKCFDPFVSTHPGRRSL